jgi:FkbM family methyltransferase
MTFRELAALADRAGGRSILSVIATKRAQALTGDPNVAVTYDDMWIDIVDGTFLPRSRKFNYYSWYLERIKQFAHERLAGSVDYWTYIYQPKTGDIIIDVGAGIGIDAIALSKLVGPSGRIHSIEAHPWTYAALRKACQLNKLNNVSTYNFAIADEPGLTWITDLEDDESNSVSKSPYNGKAIAVSGIDLDSFVRSNNIGQINLLKMNIEGAELLAIKGMSDSIKLVRHAVVACHDFRGDLDGTKFPVIEFFKANNFRIIERPDDPRPYVRDHIHAVALNLL